jgi:hypothetical protein
MIGDVVSRFPPQTPKDNIIVEDEKHTFTVLEYEDGTSSTQYEYTLDKAPVEDVRSVVGLVNGNSVEFEAGTDYQVVNSTYIDFDVGGETPDPNTEFTVDYVAEPIISRYGDAHNDETMVTDSVIQDAIFSHYLNEASGSNLDRIGSLFGDLGKRRNRSDSEYRSLLRSIVQSFAGRGTVPGLKFAIAAGVGTDPDNIIIDEDFSQIGYTVRIENVDTSFLSSVVGDMAEIADPSGVDLLAPPVLVLESGTVALTHPGWTVIDEGDGLGANTLTLDGNSQLQ